MKIDKNQKEIDVLLFQVEQIRNRTDNAVVMDGGYIALQKEAKEAGFGFLFYPHTFEFSYFPRLELGRGGLDLFSISTAGEILYPHPPEKDIVRIAQRYRKTLSRFFEEGGDGI